MLISEKTLKTCRTEKQHFLLGRVMQHVVSNKEKYPVHCPERKKSICRATNQSFYKMFEINITFGTVLITNIGNTRGHKT